MTIQKTRRPSPALGQERTKDNRVSNASGDMHSGADTRVSEINMAWRRYALRFLRSPWNSPPSAIGITSTTHNEGRTTGSICLAISLAEETTAPVALLGLDYQGYGVAEAFGIKDGPDLEGVLRGTWTPQAALNDMLVPGLAILPARAGSSRQRLTPQAFWPELRRHLPDVLSELRRDYSYIVCDLPPLLDNPDAGDLAREMDAVILLTRAGTTPLRKLEEAAALLERDRLAGAVHVGAGSALPKWLSAFLLE